MDACSFFHVLLLSQSLCPQRGPQDTGGSSLCCAAGPADHTFQTRGPCRYTPSPTHTPPPLLFPVCNYKFAFKDRGSVCFVNWFIWIIQFQTLEGNFRNTPHQHAQQRALPPPTADVPAWDTVREAGSREAMERQTAGASPSAAQPHAQETRHERLLKMCAQSPPLRLTAGREPRDRDNCSLPMSNQSEGGSPASLEQWGRGSPRAGGDPWLGTRFEAAPGQRLL